MRWKDAFIPTLKQAPRDAESTSHKLMLRAGLIRMLMAGVYSYLPLGLKVLNNIENIVRQEMDSCGANELLLPALQPLDLWLKSGRDKPMGEVMIRFTDRKGRKLSLGPTHEEVITNLVKTNVSSYKQLPLILYQIQTKFRDEIRPRFGVVRSCEFIMKDAYSFDRDQEGLDKNYDLMHQAYRRIFKRCGLDFLTIEADPGVMGGDVSHEFMVPADSGEDAVLNCPDCKLTRIFKDEDGPKSNLCPKCKRKLKEINTVEVGHIFKLQTKYSQSLQARFLDRDGKLKPMIMGCYGIGVSRLVAAIIEQNHDKDGIIWPFEISPYKIVIIPLDLDDQRIMSKAGKFYDQLKRDKITVLLDDRNEQAGVKFKDADLIGIYLQVIISKDLLNKGNIEIRLRRDKESLIKKEDQLMKEVARIVRK
jgi:prolyl-tRNA synthetase